MFMETPCYISTPRQFGGKGEGCLKDILAAMVSRRSCSRPRYVPVFPRVKHRKVLSAFPFICLNADSSGGDWPVEIRAFQFPPAQPPQRLSLPWQTSVGFQERSAWMFRLLKVSSQGQLKLNKKFVLLALIELGSL